VLMKMKLRRGSSRLAGTARAADKMVGHRSDPPREDLVLEHFAEVPRRLSDQPRPRKAAVEQVRPLRGVAQTNSEVRTAAASSARRTS